MKKRSDNQLKKYRWIGINHRGKRVSGSTLATSEAQVRAQLNAQSIALRSIKQKPVSFFTHLTQGINKKEITIFTRQLSVMLATGVPIIQALKLVTHSYQKPTMKTLLTHLISGIESGQPIANTMKQVSPLFDSFYIDLVVTGEQTGNLAEVFDRIATHREKSERLNAKVLKALIYPTAVIATSLLVTYLLLTVVIPQFKEMFDDFGAQLPWFTRQVIAFATFAQSYSIHLLVTLSLLLVIGKLAYEKSLSSKKLINRLQLKIPLVGSLITKASIARFSRTLATSFNAGIPILTALKASSQNTSNLQFQAGIELVAHDTTAGIPLYIAMRNSSLFPEMVLQMVMIGEESGRLDEMLYKIANIYEFEIDNTVDNLGKIIEPIIILFLGIMIGGLVIAMYLPIFNLMSVLG